MANDLGVALRKVRAVSISIFRLERKIFRPLLVQMNYNLKNEDKQLMSAIAFPEQFWAFIFIEINIFFPLCSSILFFTEMLEFY